MFFLLVIVTTACGSAIGEVTMNISPSVAYIGEPHNLKCVLDTPPNVTLHWKKRVDEVDEPVYYYYSEEHGPVDEYYNERETSLDVDDGLNEYTLTVHATIEEDSGDYLCELAGLEKSGYETLQVEEAPDTTTIPDNTTIPEVSDSKEDSGSTLHARSRELVMTLTALISCFELARFII